MLVAAPGATTGKTPRILVVDDEADIREAIQDLLAMSLEGSTVVAAESGAHGLRMLRDQPVDLIVTDYKMPGMNGVAFIREAEKILPGVPRVILTAFDRELMRELGAAAKQERILQKPIEPDQFLQIVEDSLARST